MVVKIHLTVLDEDGHEYSGTAAQIVRRMHNLSLAPAPNDATWMRQVADRAYSQTLVDIDDSTPESFIEGMLAAGLLKPKKD